MEEKKKKKKLIPQTHCFVNQGPILALFLQLLKEDRILDIQQGLFVITVHGRHLPPRLTHAVHDLPQVFCLAVVVDASSFGAQHGRAVTYGGVDVPRDQDGHVACCGDEFDQDVVLALRARHEDGVEGVAGFIHVFDDLLRLQGYELQCAVVPDSEAVDGLVGADSYHGSLHAGVGYRRPVAPEVAVEEEVAG